MCYLRPNNGSFNFLSNLEALVIAELLSTISGRRGSIVAWFVTDDTRIPFRPNWARPLGKSDLTASPVFWGYFKTPEELAEQLQWIWNAADGVRVYPVIDELDVERIVSPHFEDRPDDKRLGMDYESKWFIRTESRLLALLGAMLHIFVFVVRLLTSKGYRQELLDPFRQTHLTRIVERCGAYMEKGGHDNVYVLQLMTSTSGVGERFATISKKLGLNTMVRGAV